MDADRIVEHPVDARQQAGETTYVSQPLVFTATGREYFRVWLVNVLLTVVTLGIFSAWAKARRTQFFYRHTRLDGVGFDYHGEPIAILKGRILAVVLLGVYSSTGYMTPRAAGATIAALAVALPWLLGRSIRFRLHNTSHRGIRFGFDGSMRGAYWTFLALPVLTLVSLFTLAPFWHARIKQYQHGHARFGQSSFAYTSPVDEFYWTYLRAAGLSLIGGLVWIVGLAVATAIVVGGRTAGAAVPAAVPSMLLAGAIGTYLLLAIAVQSYVRARTQNIVWAATRLGRLHASVDLEPLRLAWIVFSNTLATVLTAGLYRPFGQVRLARYATGCVHVFGVEDLDRFEAGTSGDVTAAGEEAGELFDFEIGF
jgi:uncharacterized membrane protein YjgN (DUF898 family)